MYKLSELIKGNSPNLYYFIPPEIVDKPIYGKTTTVTPEEGGWVYCRKFNWYLSKLGWTDQQWYNVYILHIGRFDNVICPVCGGPINWNGKVSWGGYYEYCSIQCSQKDLINKENFCRSKSEYLINKWKDPEYRESMTNIKLNMSRYAAWSRGAQYSNILQINPKVCWFYVAWNDTEVKIGSSVVDAGVRIYFTGMPNFKIYEGLPENCIDCEYQIKVDNCDLILYPNASGHCGWTELFSKELLSRIDNYVHKFNLSLTDH